MIPAPAAAAGPLWHVSERGDIALFTPRPPPGDPSGAPVVWAVDDAHLVNYLVPRECPRVCLRAGLASDAADIARLLGGDATRVIVAIEPAWRTHAAETPLWLYEMVGERFRVVDVGAGYHVSDEPVCPRAVHGVARPLDALNARGATLRIEADLTALAAEVARSSLVFSCIRMRNTRSEPHSPP